MMNHPPQHFAPTFPPMSSEAPRQEVKLPPQKSEFSNVLGSMAMLPFEKSLQENGIFDVRALCRLEPGDLELLEDEQGNKLKPLHLKTVKSHCRPSREECELIWVSLFSVLLSLFCEFLLLQENMYRSTNGMLMMMIFF